MKIRSLAIVSLFVSFTFGLNTFTLAQGSGWEQFHGTDGHNGRAVSGPDLTKTIYKTSRFQVGSGLGDTGWGMMSSGPVVDEGKVFCYSADGSGGPAYVTAFRESSGALLWTASITNSSFGSWSSPSACGGKVYMGSGEYVFCLDAKTGQRLWSYHLTTMSTSGETYASVVNAAVTIAPELGLCYMQTYGSFGGGTRLHAIHTTDGTMAWTRDLTGQGQGAVAYNPTLRLVYTTIGAGGTWADGRGGIIAVDALTGANSWISAGSFDSLSFGGVTYDAIHNWVIAAGYNFYDYSGMLVCNATTGATVSYTGDGLAPSGDYTPTVGEDGRIYVCGAEYQDGPFAFCFDGATGANLWQTGENAWGTWNLSLTYAENNGNGKRVVYCPGGSWGDQSGNYGMFDADTGDLLATVSPNGGNAALAHGNLYYISADSKLVAFGPPVYVITATCGSGGSISPGDQAVTSGGSVTYTITPNMNYHIQNVLIDGSSIGTPNSYTFLNVTNDLHTISVTFSVNP